MEYVSRRLPSIINLKKQAKLGLQGAAIAERATIFKIAMAPPCCLSDRSNSHFVCLYRKVITISKR